MIVSIQSRIFRAVIWKYTNICLKHTSHTVHIVYNKCRDHFLNRNKGYTTIEHQPTSGGVFSHLVFGQALVSAGVILLEAGNLQHSVGILHFDFTGERYAISPLPCYLRNRTGRDRGGDKSFLTFPIWNTPKKPWHINFQTVTLLYKNPGELCLECKSAEDWNHASRNSAYFPRAKHSSVTVDPLAASTLSGKLTSIFGSYSPITPM